MYNNPLYFLDVIDYFNLLEIYFSKHIDNNLLIVEANNKQFYFYELNSTIKNQKKTSSIIIHQDVWLSRNAQVKSRIKSLLGLNKKIHARQCVVKQIEKKEAEVFMNENHIGGYCKSAYKFGLYFNDEVFAVATFSKGRRMNRLTEEQRSYELLGFATKANYTIVGGFDKLLKYFTKLKTPDDIMTYVDLEWSNAKTFTNLGFEIVGQSKPITFYVDEHFVRHKQMDEFKQRTEITNLGNIKLIKKLC